MVPLKGGVAVGMGVGVGVGEAPGASVGVGVAPSFAAEVPLLTPLVEGKDAVDGIVMLLFGF